MTLIIRLIEFIAFFLNRDGVEVQKGGKFYFVFRSNSFLNILHENVDNVIVKSIMFCRYGETA